MVAASPERIIRAPGRLVVNPTDFSAAYPYGGTEIGNTRQVFVQALGTPVVIESELLGEPTDVLEGANRYIFACLLRGWDDDAVAQFFSDNYTAGGTSQHATWSAPGSVVPGASALARAVSIVFVPDDLTRVPALIVRNGVPYWTPGADLAFSRTEDMELPITVECLRDGSNRIIDIARIADLTV